MEYSDAGGSVRATGINLLRRAWEGGLKMWETFKCDTSSIEFCLFTASGFSVREFFSICWCNTNGAKLTTSKESLIKKYFKCDFALYEQAARSD